GYDYVDLGLPSGTLWASHDIGADGVGMLGSFFMWGETVPRDENTEWNSEDHKYTSQSGEYTKYCEQDEKSVLDPIDDAATSLWGSNWRMSSLTDWKELAKFCDIEVRNGQIVVVGPNGNEMILPIYSYNKFEGFDFSCSWWTSEADPDCYYDSNLFYIDKETDGELDFDDISDCRDVLCAIRPVSKIRADLNYQLPDDEEEEEYEPEVEAQNSYGSFNYGQNNSTQDYSQQDSYSRDNYGSGYNSRVDEAREDNRSLDAYSQKNKDADDNHYKSKTYIDKEGYEKTNSSKTSYVMFLIAALIIVYVLLNR
ncbi:MAG: hypothetical protein KBT22_05540, partial [Bacteroidales bacterium]|nr:hypothetical protein [Candidatus Scybalocola fimicaballi]